MTENIQVKYGHEGHSNTAQGKVKDCINLSPSNTLNNHGSALLKIFAVIFVVILTMASV